MLLGYANNLHIVQFNNLVFHIFLFDAAKIHIVAGSAKLLGYSAQLCDGWYKKNQGRNDVPP